MSDRRAGDAKMYFFGAGLSKRADLAPRRRAANHGILDHHQPLARDRFLDDGELHLDGQIAAFLGGHDERPSAVVARSERPTVRDSTFAGVAGRGALPGV